MVSANRLRAVMAKLLSDCAHADFPYDRVADTMSQFEDENGITLSEYGYVMWAVDHYGW